MPSTQKRIDRPSSLKSRFIFLQSLRKALTYDASPRVQKDIILIHPVFAELLSTKLICVPLRKAVQYSALVLLNFLLGRFPGLTYDTLRGTLARLL